jgi:hypothetical protein
VARFRQIDVNDPHLQHDALEFPDGQVLKVTQLTVGQTATVLQLPVATQHPEHVETAHGNRSDSRVALNRVPLSPGMASILMPNQGAVMLWQTCRSAANSLSAVMVRSVRRWQAHTQDRMLTIPAGRTEASAMKDALAVTPPMRPAARKPEKKIAVKAANEARGTQAGEEDRGQGCCWLTNRLPNELPRDPAPAVPRHVSEEGASRSRLSRSPAFNRYSVQWRRHGGRSDRL